MLHESNKASDGCAALHNEMKECKRVLLFNGIVRRKFDASIIIIIQRNNDTNEFFKGGFIPESWFVAACHATTEASSVSFTNNDLGV